ncbi:unnamed protein product, partial [Brenthis ino]
MKLYVCLSILIAAIVVVECSHTFVGTSVFRQLVYHKDAKYSANLVRKRVENITYTLPPTYGYGRSIQGILAYDLSNSGASANITAGGVGYPFVTIRMKSDRGRGIHYDINIYA